ncbi:sialidase family protein [Thalassoroseus pseudoceratinae]|uniref:sialidase family protein n=1 Tax=Thalassoroseus pseudoceratinae TaxID=2713176 RepID=UPI00141E9332|nr:sialidase family protein [Thalassoroseus pseudoceratinae]
MPFSLVRVCLVFGIALVSFYGDSAAADPVQRNVLLPPTKNNPRNSEGDMIELKDGRLLLVYTHFTDGAGDHAKAHLAGRYSSDGGVTWTEDDELVVDNEAGMNVMSVSLLRLADERIALFYLRKNSTQDCEPVLRISEDEAKSWSEPIEIVPEDEVGYYVLNNDRVIQTKSGRLIVPLAQHYAPGWERWRGGADMVCYTSDDIGKTWKRSPMVPVAEPIGGKAVVTQEPGVVELADGRIMLWCRTNAGSQYVSYSKDDGTTWSQLKPSNMLSPVSPATIERIPSSDKLLLVWNDHQNIPAKLRGKRTPLSVAISSDHGQTWQHTKVLEDNPNGWYCYIAMDFVDDHVVLSHCAGDRTQNNGLALTQITRFPLAWVSATNDKP